MPAYDQKYIEELSEKFLEGTITDEENAILDTWYAQRTSTVPVWDLNGETRQNLEDRLLNEVHGRLGFKTKSSSLWKKLSIAASILLVSAAGLTIYISKHPKTEITQYSFSCTDGHIRKVLLPDHSLVWLKGNSSLEYPSRFSDSTRNVVLHGEALFEVSKDKRHPFIIRAGNYVTRVLGTSFNIKENAKANFFKLTVLTGKVLVTSSQKDINHILLKAPVIITPGNDLEIGNINQVPKIELVEPAFKTSIVNGTEYNMDFSNSSFDEVKSRIEKKFNVSIQSDDKTYQACLLSANLTDQSLENTLKVLCAAMGANYTVNNLRVTITGGGCN